MKEVSQRPNFTAENEYGFAVGIRDKWAANGMYGFDPELLAAILSKLTGDRARVRHEPWGVAIVERFTGSMWVEL